MPCTAGVLAGVGAAALIGVRGMLPPPTPGSGAAECARNWSLYGSKWGCRGMSIAADAAPSGAAPG